MHHLKALNLSSVLQIVLQNVETCACLFLVYGLLIKKKNNAISRGIKIFISYLEQGLSMALVKDS